MRLAIFSLSASFSSSLMLLSPSTIFYLLSYLRSNSSSTPSYGQQITQQPVPTASSWHGIFPGRTFPQTTICLGLDTVATLSQSHLTFLQLLNRHLYFRFVFWIYCNLTQSLCHQKIPLYVLIIQLHRPLRIAVALYNAISTLSKSLSSR